jgi:hypothetical protein
MSTKTQLRWSLFLLHGGARGKAQRVTVHGDFLQRIFVYIKGGDKADDFCIDVIEKSKGYEMSAGLSEWMGTCLRNLV